MERVSMRVCLISARWLRISPSLWKRHWFAVGWIDPMGKYCSRIDCSGNPNPVWNTKFSALVDDSELLTLHVQVYSRNPFFVTERLRGSATASLFQFLRKCNDGLGNREGVGSYQLRKNDSGKPRGFVDVSVCVMSKNGEEPPFYPEYGGGGGGGGGGEIMLLDHNDRIIRLPKSVKLLLFLKDQQYSPWPLTSNRTGSRQKNLTLTQPHSPQIVPNPAWKVLLTPRRLGLGSSSSTAATATNHKSCTKLPDRGKVCEFAIFECCGRATRIRHWIGNLSFGRRWHDM